MQIRLRNKKIGDNNPVFIIAEIGINHNGDPDLASKMIGEAARAGADAVKLQIVNPDESYAKDTLSYQIFKKASLTFDALKKLKDEAARKDVIFFATAGDLTSLDMMMELGMPLIKISSGCMTNFLLIRKAARTKVPIMLSTGMSYLSEVKETIFELEKNGAKDIVLLHCVSTYPAAYEEINLNSMVTLKSLFRYPVGYSDHAEGVLASCAAVAIGAKVIEKHFTLNKKFKGPDHRFSADPKELKQLVEDIRNIEKLMGSEVKRPTKTERRSRDTIRRFLVATKDLAKGSIMTKGDIGIKRIGSGNGLSPKYYDSILGKKIVKGIKKDKPLTLSLLK